MAGGNPLPFGRGKGEGGVELARKLRQNQTDVKKKLWFLLRDRRLLGFKFRRQQPIGKYVADFCCFEQKLIVEVDGGQHSIAANRDEERTSALKRNGFRVLRFWNHEIQQNIEGVLAAVDAALKAPSPQASPSRERK
ncbi:MAG: endonuclease domain-containing protein [Candidatus Omnitrophota bacterium]